jgi:hypothetical protein
MVCKGVILDLIPVTDTVMQVVIRVKKSDSYFPLAFTAYLEIKVLIQQIKIEKGQDKYFTSAVVEKIKIITKKPSQQLIVDLSTGEIIG